MEAHIARSKVKTPHKGRFLRVKRITSEIWNVNKVRHVHLIIDVEGGPYHVLRMDEEAAREIVRDMLAKLDRTDGA